jgi:hypothetical protein
MSNFSRLLGLAQKALDKTSSSTPDARGGQGDWRSVVRSAAEALTGDGRPGASGPAASGPVATGPVASAPGTTTTTPASAATAPAASSTAAASARGAQGADIDPADRAAIARYDYLLQTADPHQIEQVHREAFARLTPAQRAQIDERMRAELPAHEQPRSSTPDDLARSATRTEMGRPGFLRGLLARAGGGGTPGPGSRSGGVMGAGARSGAIGGAVAGAGLAAGGMLAAVAGGAVVSSVAAPLLEQAAGLGVDFDALAGAVDLEGLTGGIEGLAAGGIEGLAGGVEGLSGGVDEVAAGAGETVSGLGEQVSGFGDRVRELGSGFEIPGLGDFFGR